jgi:hypothetical protein
MKKFVLMYLYAIFLGSVTSSPLPSTMEPGSIYAVKNLVEMNYEEHVDKEICEHDGKMAVYFHAWGVGTLNG